MKTLQLNKSSELKLCAELVFLNRRVPVRRWQIFVLVCWGTFWLAGCATNSVNNPAAAIYDPAPDVTLEAEWRNPLVDNGLWAFEPRELGRLSFDDSYRHLYVGTSVGRMVAVSAQDGRISWEVDLGEPIDGQAALAGNYLYFGAADGNFYALDSTGGSERWRFESGGNIDGTPAVTDDFVVFSSADGAVVALNREDGSPVWSISDSGTALGVSRGLFPPVKGQSSPEILEGVVYAGFPSGRLVAINVNSGQVAWSIDLGDSRTRHTDVDEPVVVIGDSIYAVSFSGGVYGLDRTNGDIVWHQELRGATRVVSAGEHLLTTTVEGLLVALDPEDGDIIYQVDLQSEGPGRVSLLGDYAVIATSNGPLFIVDALSPQIYAEFSPSSGFASAAVGQDGQIVALDNQGVLHGLRLRYR